MFRTVNKSELKNCKLLGSWTLRDILRGLDGIYTQYLELSKLNNLRIEAPLSTQSFNARCAWNVRFYTRNAIYLNKWKEKKKYLHTCLYLFTI